VLSKRLRSVLPGLIGKSQSAFVEGRQILDGALIANEAVQWLKKKKREGVILKLDFQKAYDTIDWRSLEMVQRVMGFGSRWRNWIKQCVSSATISLLINGVPTKPFKMGRGLRQGDPLSPFLFLLMAEVLNKMFSNAVESGQLRGLKIGVNEVLLSHLQFADDTLLFSEADQQQLKLIKSLLFSFQALSGLAVNYSKSALVVLGRDEVWARETAKILGCSYVKLPIIYLGIPLGDDMKKASSWQGIIDRIQSKLQSWKSSCLSRAGRLTLIKAVVNCLPIYYLSLFRMPKKVANEIIRMQRRFLWNEGKSGRILPLVKWEVIQQPKCKGGLGVGDLVTKNAALLFKWWWRYVSEENSLWRKVVQSVHNEDNTIFPSYSLSKVPGPWQNMKKLLLEQHPAAQTFLHHISITVGKGSKISFWEDRWAGDSTLKDKFPSLYRLSTQQEALISSMGWFEGHLWKWTLAWKKALTQSEIKLVEDLKAVLATHAPLPNKEDIIHWKGKNEYSARILQQLMFMEMEVEVDSLVCSVWMNLVPPKVEFFMWVTLLGKLNTKEMLWKKGILSVNQNSCTFCSANSESLDHVLLHCPFSWKVWCSVAEDLGQNLVCQSTFNQFYSSCLSIQWRSKSMKKIWISTVFAIPWRLWMERNEMIFHQKEWNLTEICHSVKWKVATWTKAWKEQIHYKVDDLARNFSSLHVLLQ